MNTAELLEKTQDESIQSIIDAVNPNYRKRFRRLCSGLDKLIREIQKDFPDAQYFAVDQGALTLMLGDTHDEAGSTKQLGTSNQELIAEDVGIRALSGGGF